MCDGIKKAVLLPVILLIVGSVVISSDASARTIRIGQPLSVLTAGLVVRATGVSRFTCENGKPIAYAVYAPKGSTDPGDDQVQVLLAPTVGPNLLAITYDPDEGTGDAVMIYLVDNRGIVVKSWDPDSAPDDPCPYFASIKG